MKEYNGGGPAFPQPYVPAAKENYYPACEDPKGTGGMSLRDYFAAKAMQTILSARNDIAGTTELPNWLASTAYQMADAMLKQRDK